MPCESFILKCKTSYVRVAYSKLVSLPHQSEKSELHHQPQNLMPGYFACIDRSWQQSRWQRSNINSKTKTRPIVNENNLIISAATCFCLERERNLFWFHFSYPPDVCSVSSFRAVCGTSVLHNLRFAECSDTPIAHLHSCEGASPRAPSVLGQTNVPMGFAPSGWYVMYLTFHSARSTLSLSVMRLARRYSWRTDMMYVMLSYATVTTAPWGLARVSTTISTILTFSPCASPQPLGAKRERFQRTSALKRTARMETEHYGAARLDTVAGKSLRRHF